MIIAAQHNTPLEDLATANNYARPIIAGGTGANNNASAATNLKVVSYQAQILTDDEQETARENILASPSLSLLGYIYGLTLINTPSPGDTTNDIDISPGSAGSSESEPVLMTLASTLTKRLDAAWAVGSGNGGLDTGAVGNNIYYVWEIQRSDTGVVDALFSLSSTSPTMPANYDRKRIIGSFARVSGANNVPRSYSQKEPTPWVQYTATITGFGAPSSVRISSRRNGSNLELMGVFASGTSTAVTAAVSLGYDGTNGRLTIDTAWNSARFVCGSGASNINGPAAYVTLGIGGATDMNFGVSVSGRASITPINGDALLSSGNAFSFSASVPIHGWN